MAKEMYLVFFSSHAQRIEGDLTSTFRADTSKWSCFFESLMHAQQFLLNIEFKNQLSILLCKLVVCWGYLILILGSKINNFLVLHQKFNSKYKQKFKNWVFKKFSQKLQKMFVSDPFDFWIQCFYKILWHVWRIQKSHPIWMRLKVEVDYTPSALCMVHRHHSKLQN